MQPHDSQSSNKKRAHHDSLALQSSGVGGAVRPHQAVDVELGIVHRLPEIAPVAPELHLLPLPVLATRVQALVHPVPDEAPLQSML